MIATIGAGALWLALGLSLCALVAAAAWWRGPIALTVGASLLVVAGVAVGVLLGRSPLEPPSGPGRPGDAVSVSPQLESLRNEVESESTPTKKLLAFAHLALDEGQTAAAIWAYKRVLAREPKNAEAITHLGLILYQGNHVDQALARVEEALAIDPNYVHAHWDRAQILFFGSKDYPAAARALEGFLALVASGEDAERARAMLAEARQRSAGGKTDSAAPSPRRPPAMSVVPAVVRRPLPPERFTGQAALAYRAAHEVGDTLAQLKCYCGCDVTAGHQNLRACFLDTHGST